MEEARGREVAVIWRDPRELTLIFESVRPSEGPRERERGSTEPGVGPVLTQEDLVFWLATELWYLVSVQRVSM